MGILNKYKVIEIPSKKTEEWLLNKHYAKRKCNVMKSFALVNGDEIVGDKKFKKHNTEIIKNHFIIYPYPKGQNENYDTSYEIKDKFLEPKLF